MRLHNRIIIVSVCCTQLAVISCIWMMSQKSEKYLIQQESDFVEYQTFVRVSRFETGIQQLNNDIQLLAQTELTKRFLNLRTKRIEVTTASFMKEIFSKNIDYSQVRLIDKDGIEILRLNKVNNQIEVTPNNQLQDKSQRNYFKQAIIKRNHEVYLSPINLNRELGEITEPHAATLRAAAPIYDNAKLLGVAVINWNLNNLMDNLILSAQDDFITLINPHGYFLAHPNRRFTFGLDLNPQYTVKNLHPEITVMLNNLSVINHYGLLLRRQQLKKQIDFDHISVAIKYQYGDEEKDHFTLFIKHKMHNLIAARQGFTSSFFIASLFSLVLTIAIAKLSFRQIPSTLDRISRQLAALAPNTKSSTGRIEPISDLNQVSQNIAKLSVNAHNQYPEQQSDDNIRQMTLQALPHGVIVLNNEGRILYCNTELLEQFHYTLAELKNQLFTLLFPAKFAFTVSQIIKNQLAGQSETQPPLAGLTKDGDTFPMTLHVKTFTLKQQCYIAITLIPSQEATNEHAISA